MLTMLWGRRAVKYVIANAEDVRKKQGSGARVALPGYLERSDYFSEILAFFEHASLVSPHLLWLLWGNVFWSPFALTAVLCSAV